MSLSAVLLAIKITRAKFSLFCCNCTADKNNCSGVSNGSFNIIFSLLKTLFGFAIKRVCNRMQRFLVTPTPLTPANNQTRWRFVQQTAANNIQCHWALMPLLTSTYKVIFGGGLRKLCSKCLAKMFDGSISKRKFSRGKQLNLVDFF